MSSTSSNNGTLESILSKISSKLKRPTIYIPSIFLLLVGAFVYYGSRKQYVNVENVLNLLNPETTWGSRIKK